MSDNPLASYHCRSDEVAPNIELGQSGRIEKIRVNAQPLDTRQLLGRRGRPIFFAVMAPELPMVGTCRSRTKMEMEGGSRIPHQCGSEECVRIVPRSPGSLQK